MNSDSSVGTVVSPVTAEPHGVQATEPPLDHSLASGIAWTAVMRWAAQLFSWVATFYAARLLQPGDYGLVSMATLGIGLARMVEDFGMDSILIQDRSLVGQMQSRLAGFLIGVGFVLCVLFALTAPLIAGFFHEPQVAGIIVAMSLMFLLDAAQIVPRAQLQRQLQFRRLAVVGLVQVVATSILLMAAARAGWGHWALVINSIGGAVAATVLLIFWQPYSVAWPRELARLSRPLFQGWRILASRAAWYGYTNADQTIIGRMLGKDALGAYSFAVTFSSLSIQEVGSVVSRVVPGIFSEVQDRKGELRRYFLLLTEFLAVLMFPMSVGMALTADLWIPLVLGPEWDSVIAPLRLLCIYSLFLTSQLLTSHVLMWTGQFRINMWCSILPAVAMPPILLVAVQYGLPGLAFSWAAIFPVFNIPSIVFALRTIDVSAKQWFDSLKPATMGCILMSAAVFGLRAILPAALPLIATTTVVIGAGAAVYAAVLWFGFGRRVRAMLDVGRTIRSGQVV